MSPSLLRRREVKNELQTLLLHACPPDIVDGSVSIPRLADALDMTSQGIYRWINRGKIPASQVKAIVKLSEGNKEPLTFDQFMDFLS